MSPELIAYLQILIVLLVLAFGLPSVLFQISLPDEIRNVVRKRIRLFPWAVWLTVHTLACFVIIWFGVDYPDEIEALAKLVVSWAILVVPVFWWSLYRYPVRRQAAEDLRKQITASYRKKGIIPDDLVEDLVTVGEYGRNGQEKALVLNEIDALIDHVQESCKYSGGQLETVLKSLGTRLVGREENLFQTVSLLQKAGRRALSEDVKAVDSLISKQMLKKLALHAVDQRSDAVGLAALDWDDPTPRLIFDIGCKAIRRNRVRIAIGCLNRLETLAELRQADVESMSFLLGLSGLLAGTHPVLKERIHRSPLWGKKSDAVVDAKAFLSDIGELDACKAVEELV